MRGLVGLDAGIVGYKVAAGWQRILHARRVAGEIEDTLLTLEHPHVFTIGRNFAPEHLLVSRHSLAQRGVEVVEADRGGSITYHGPGQLVAYPVIDLRGAAGRLPDLPGYLRLLESAVIQTVGEFGVRAEARRGLTGVWVGNAKLACIGINVSRGVSRHGLALNVTTELDHFDSMVPCGIAGCRMTSLEKLLDHVPARAEVACALSANLAEVLNLRLRAGTFAGTGLEGPAALRFGA